MSPVLAEECLNQYNQMHASYARYTDDLVSGRDASASLNQYETNKGAYDKCVADSLGPIVDEGDCYDRKQNGDEEGVDCGGRCPIACQIDQPKPDPKPDTGTCSDGFKNDDEEGVDCGGRCLNSEKEICDDKIDNNKDCFVDCSDDSCNGELDSRDMLDLIDLKKPANYGINADPACRCIPVTKINGGDTLDILMVARDYENRFGALTVAKEIKDDTQEIADFMLKTLPFSKYKDKINIWNIREMGSLSKAKMMCPASDFTVVLIGQCDGDPAKNCRSSSGLTETKMYTTVGQPNGPLFLHEFGHLFGDLSDEYIVSWGDKKYIGYVPARMIDKWLGAGNCAQISINPFTTADEDCRSQFKSTAPPVTQEPECVFGCWASNWMRFQDKSIMRSNYKTTSDYTPNYGPVAEYILELEMMSYV